MQHLYVWNVFEQMTTEFSYWLECYCELILDNLAKFLQSFCVSLNVAKVFNVSINN